MTKTTLPNKNAEFLRSRYIVRVPVYSVVVVHFPTKEESIAPFIAHDAHIQINAAMPDNPLTRPGKRLNWPQESETK